jgi:hypothetical protein
VAIVNGLRDAGDCVTLAQLYASHPVWNQSQNSGPLLSLVCIRAVRAAPTTRGALLESWRVEVWIVYQGGRAIRVRKSATARRASISASRSRDANPPPIPPNDSWTRTESLPSDLIDPIKSLMCLGPANDRQLVSSSSSGVATRRDEPLARQVRLTGRQ